MKLRTTVRLMLVMFALTGMAFLVRAGLARPGAPSDASSADRRDLVAAVGTQRLLVARIVGGFAYGPEERHEDIQAAPERPPAVRMVAARLEANARDELTAGTLSGLGLSRLVLGDAEGAVRAFEAARRTREDGVIASDLAAAYLLRYEQQAHLDDLARAIDAAEVAYARAPTLAEAVFNRALAFEWSGLRTQARAAWTAYLKLDGTSGWAREARTHLATLDQHDEDWETWMARVGLSLTASSTALVDEAVRRFPQAAREWLEREVALAWSEAVRDNAYEDRLAIEQTALAVAMALFATTGDRLALDVAHEYRAGAAELARAHHAYVTGMTLYRRHERTASGEQFAAAEAGFRRAGSVQWTWAAVQRATVAYQQRDLKAARAHLARVDAATRGLPYPIVRARVSWLTGYCEMQEGRLAQAVMRHRTAAEAYVRAGESELAGHVYNTWADVLRILGEYRSGWQVLHQALRLSPSFRDPIRRYLVFFNASLYALRDGRLHASLAYENAAVEQAEQDKGSPAAQVEARLRRAALLGRLSRHTEAEADLRQARSLLPGVRDPTQAAYFRATADAVEGEAFVDRADAVARVDAALPVLERAEPAELPRLLLAKSRGLRARGHWDNAERTLDRAIDTFEDRRRRLKTSDDRVAYLDHGADLYRELASLRLQRGRDSADAFAAIERGRARTLFEDVAGSTTAAQTLPAIQQKLPPHTVAVVYSVLPTHLLTWVITASDVRFFNTAIAADELRRQVEALQALLDLQASRQQLRQASIVLHALLLAPWLDGIARNTVLVVVPDGPLHLVPFAMLQGPDDEYLVQRHPIAWAPSASLLVQVKPKTSRSQAQFSPRPLIVGNARVAGDRDGVLQNLLEPGQEVREIASLYAAPQVLIERSATLSAIETHLPRADIFHFAGHAIVDPYAPQLSRLIVTPDPNGPETAALYASAIARLDLHDVRVVVLAACSTAAGAVRAGEGVMSIARAFLVAGAPAIVATQWEIEDRSARTAFVALHRALRAGRAPVDALRDAQLAMLASDDPVLRYPRQWAGLLVIRVGADGSSANRPAQQTAAMTEQERRQERSTNHDQRTRHDY